MAITGLQTASAGTTASLLRSAEQNTGVAARLLKKAVDADKDLVSTLLPLNGPDGGTLNLRA
ncbi:MAG TPA: hypothetical protein VFB21_19275 [Chthonomonadaceae bacterium]|jgi:hypothetical protein|nr:hypothetical protein [Chthonomonadaceae bacterium]